MKDIVIQLISTTGTIMVVLLPIYFNLKKHIDRKTEETKQFNDISVQKLNGLLTSVIHSFDKPMWLKIAIQDEHGDVQFKMSEINHHYERMFKKPRMQYIGKTDLEAGWDKKEADRFREHDLLVWASGEPVTFMEAANGVDYTFRKVRVEDATGNLKGILGYLVEK